MQFFPRQFKFKKNFRAKPCKRVAPPRSFVSSHRRLVSLSLVQAGLLSATQLLAFKLCITKRIKKLGTCVFYTFPQKTKSRKASGGRMGKGKGGDRAWFCTYPIGFVLCTINIAQAKIGVHALVEARHRLPIQAKVLLS